MHELSLRRISSHSLSVAQDKTSALRQSSLTGRLILSHRNKKSLKRKLEKQKCRRLSTILSMEKNNSLYKSVTIRMNLLHDIAAGTADEMNVIIEIPKFSKNKYEIDKETGIIALYRVMHTAQDYPFDYGFVPQTLFDDGDALDVVVLTTYPLAPGILVRVRPVALLNMVDDGDNDNKVIAVPVKDPRWDEVQDLSDLNKHFIKEMTHFFETYKKVQKKEVTVGEWHGKAEAQAAFKKSREAYTAAK